jgi:hypothetical protein
MVDVSNRLLARVFGLWVALGLFAFAACSSDSASGDDDDDDNEGGRAGSISKKGGAGGLPTGGAGASGGTTGGASGSAAGGTGAGGSSAGSLQLRCFDYGDNYRICYGTPGTDNWAIAWKRCSIEPSKNDPAYEVVAGPAAASCEGLPGLPDSSAGWDEVFCLRHISSGLVLCFGRLGDYWLEIFPDCSWADQSSTPFAGDPAALFCGAPSVANGGWDELRCFDPGGDAVVRCWGRRGAYWVGPSAAVLYLNALTPTCQLDPDGTAIEISPDQVPCPAAGAGGGGAGGSGGAPPTGGSGGSGPAAGSGGNPACPATQPPVTGPAPTCTVGTHCFYPGSQCDCFTLQEMGRWACATCPSTLPVNGSSCVPDMLQPAGGATCNYGTARCYCDSVVRLWACSQ